MKSQTARDVGNSKDRRLDAKDSNFRKQKLELTFSRALLEAEGFLKRLRIVCTYHTYISPLYLTSSDPLFRFLLLSVLAFAVPKKEMPKKS